MATQQLTGALGVADHPALEPMTATDVAAHEAASYVRPASRRLVAAGVKRGTGPLIVEQPADFTPAVAR